MNLSLRSVLVSSLLLCGSSFAASRTYVATEGDDARPCTRKLPCRTIGAALDRTTPGGEVVVDDYSGTGGVTITKSVTITAHNTLAAVFAPYSDGIVIKAGPNDVVKLKGLDIQGDQSGIAGVRFVSGKGLVLEDCSISGFATAGLHFGAPAESDARLTLINTRVSNTSELGSNVVIAGGIATLTGASIVDGYVGITTLNDAQLTITNSRVAGNSSAGVNASDASEVSIKHTVISGNGGAIEGNSTVRLTDTMVTRNKKHPVMACPIFL